MVRSFRKQINSALVAAITAVALTSSCLLIAPSANAGIVLFASYASVDGFIDRKDPETSKKFDKIAQIGEGAGGVLFLSGLIIGSAWLIVLGTDGSLDQDQLTKNLAAHYPELDSLAVMDLSQAIAVKAAQTQAGADGKKMVSFSRAELAEVFQAAEVQPQLFDKIAADMQ